MRLQKGTRVVMRVAVPAAAGVLPLGTVAELVGVPTASQHTFRVRFHNGHEASIEPLPARRKKRCPPPKSTGTKPRCRG